MIPKGSRHWSGRTRHTPRWKRRGAFRWGGPQPAIVRSNLQGVPPAVGAPEHAKSMVVRSLSVGPPFADRQPSPPRRRACCGVTATRARRPQGVGGRKTDGKFFRYERRRPNFGGGTVGLAPRVALERERSVSHGRLAGAGIALGPVAPEGRGFFFPPAPFHLTCGRCARDRSRGPKALPIPAQAARPRKWMRKDLRVEGPIDAGRCGMNRSASLMDRAFSPLLPAPVCPWALRPRLEWGRALGPQTGCMCGNGESAQD